MTDLSKLQKSNIYNCYIWYEGGYILADEEDIYDAVYGSNLYGKYYIMRGKEEPLSIPEEDEWYLTQEETFYISSPDGEDMDVESESGEIVRKKMIVCRVDRKLVRKIFKIDCGNSSEVIDFPESCIHKCVVYETPLFTPQSLEYPEQRREDAFLVIENGKEEFYIKKYTPLYEGNPAEFELIDDKEFVEFCK